MGSLALVECDDQIPAAAILLCRQQVYEGGEIELATMWKMELQYYGKITCNFLQKTLAKNNENYDKDKRKILGLKIKRLLDRCNNK